MTQDHDRQNRVKVSVMIGAMVLLALLAAFAFQGTRGLYDTTEGRYAECAREMVETGNYLEPTLAYRPHWSKPPLTYWAIAGGIRLLGKNAWGVRLYDAAAFFLTVLAVFAVGKLWWGNKTGILAGLIYLSSPFPLFSANIASTDTLLTLWEILAVFCFLAAHARRSRSRNSPWIVGMWVFLGLGFLTKGPPALLPFVPILVWNLWKRRGVKLLNPLGLFLFFGIGLSWYLVVSHRHPALLSYFLGHEMAARFTSGAFHNSEWYKPFILYLPLLAFGAGLWLYPLVRSLQTPRSFQRIQEMWRGEGKGFFLILWVVFPLVLFFLAKSRLPLYVLPLFAPVVLLMARGVLLAEEGHGMNVRRWLSMALISVGIMVGLKGFAAFYPSSRNMKSLYRKCKAFGGEGSRVAVFDRRKLYGLQFYLDGRLERVSYTGREAWADAGIQQVLELLRKDPAKAPNLFVVDKEQEKDFRKLLDHAHLSYERDDGAYWRLYRLKAGKGTPVPPKRRSPEVPRENGGSVL